MVGGGLVALTALASVVFGACADLDGLSGGSGDAGTPESSVAADASSDVEQPDAATNDGPLIPDAESRPDGEGRVDASDCSTCDCDDDGFLSARPGCSDAGSTDCDDFDPFRSPGQTKFIDELPSGHLGDWNCSGAVEKLYPTGVACTGNGGPACDGRFGFTGDPPCGATGPFVTCKTGGALGLNCVEAERKVSTQACR